VSVDGITRESNRLVNGGSGSGVDYRALRARKADRWLKSR
jgi:hypothetical protein